MGGSAVAITYFGVQLLFQALLIPLLNGRDLSFAGGILVFALLLPLINLGIALAVSAVYAVYVHLMEKKRTLTEFSAQVRRLTFEMVACGLFFSSECSYRLFEPAREIWQLTGSTVSDCIMFRSLSGPPPCRQHARKSFFVVSCFD